MAFLRLVFAACAVLLAVPAAAVARELDEPSSSSAGAMPASFVCPAVVGGLQFGERHQEGGGGGCTYTAFCSGKPCEPPLMSMVMWMPGAPEMDRLIGELVTGMTRTLTMMREGEGPRFNGAPVHYFVGSKNGVTLAVGVWTVPSSRGAASVVIAYDVAREKEAGSFVAAFAKANAPTP